MDNNNNKDEEHNSNMDGERGEGMREKERREFPMHYIEPAKCKYCAVF